MGISRQAVYQQRLRAQQRCDLLEPVKGLVLELRRYMPRLGTRKLYFLLKQKFDALNIKIGRDAFFDYLRHNDLLVTPKRSYTKTTYSKHWMKKHPNLLQEMKLKRVEQVFVSDITYVESDEGVHYLSLVTDAVSRKIMGYELSHEMKASDTVKALEQAACSRLTALPLIHHSDRASGKPFKPSTQAIRMSFTPRFCSSVRTPSQNFAPSFSDSHMPNSSFWPSRFTPKAR